MGCWRKPRIPRKLISGALATYEDFTTVGLSTAATYSLFRCWSVSGWHGRLCLQCAAGDLLLHVRRGLKTDIDVEDDLRPCNILQGNRPREGLRLNLDSRI